MARSLAFTTRTESDDAVNLTQYGHSRLRAVYIARSGVLVAMGDGTSYQVSVDLVDGRVRIMTEAFPRLYWSLCALDFLPLDLRAECQLAQATFSHELRAGLIGGFDRW